ncbi:MAG: extracellular solute-binding protein [Anaeroplasmataceae bacterium]|jgi:ABC-type sugar transport system, periplasmic component|nr:extracellular solute-binding protein [Anaeroplasmataceae bacterium]
MKKKLLGAFLCTAVAGVALASCTDKDTSHTITFWHTMGDSLQKVLNPAIEQFQKDHEGWTIESTQIGSYNDVRNQTIAYIAAGNNPSLVYCYPDHIATYNKSLQVVDLNTYIKDPELGFTQAQLDDFIEGYYQEGSAFGDGAMYSLPFSKSTEVIYYNKTVFEEEELNVPTTWEEMEEVCRVLKLRYPDSTPLGIDSESNFFITTAAQKGVGYTSATGEHYIFDNAENRATVQMLKDWFDKGYVTTQSVYGTYTSGLFVSEESKRSFMSIGSTGGANHQTPSNGRFEVGMAKIPTFAGKDLKAISQGPSLAMLKQSSEEKMQMTWIFMRDYLLTTEFQAEFSMASGYNPVLKSTYDNPVYSAWLDGADGVKNVAALAAKTSQTFSDSFFVSDAFIGSSTARDEVGELVVNVLKGTATLEDAFATALRNCNKDN